MATAYSSVEYALNPSPRCDAVGVFSIYGHFNLSAALVINDTIAMFQLPLNARVLSMELSSDDVDTNTTPLVTMSVGDSNSATRFIAASIIGRAGGTISMKDATYGTRAGFGYRYDTETKQAYTPILVTIAAAPATSATTGTIKLVATVAVDD